MSIKQYTKKDGTKRWKFEEYLGINPKTGKKDRVKKSNFKTKKEAQLALNRIRNDYEINGLQKEHNETFKEIYDLWYESYKKTVKEATALATERYMRLHALPVLGDYKIAKITPIDAQKITNDWSEKIQTYKLLLQYTSRVIEFAITLDIIQKNPFDRTIRPKPIDKSFKREFKHYTISEVEHVMNYLTSKVKAVKDDNVLYKYFAEWDLALYRTLAFSGLRASEALALSWNDIDLTSKTLDVNKNLSKTKNGYSVQAPKTKSSIRIVTLDDKTISILKKWKLRQKELYFQIRTKSQNIVFADMYGQYSNRQALYMRSNRVADFANVPRIGTHGWRHTHATMLFEAGVDLKEAQERLGHSSIEITSNIYTHLSAKRKKQTADKLSKFANF
ncbi:tyrosine-type recombinase/integrase [Enterococcus casseliflavus]|uniref:tyrosine-type recombinase/integrase n=1 Tax=Enterococcus casseliflavus TaxID=37734 RepID=UPI0039A6C128